MFIINFAHYQIRTKFYYLFLTQKYFCISLTSVDLKLLYEMYGSLERDFWNGDFHINIFGEFNKWHQKQETQPLRQDPGFLQEFPLTNS
jgi:hypothetical protein